MAMNPLKEMIPSNKKGRRWHVLNEKGEGSVIGSVYESTLRVVFTKRLYEAMILQGISNVRDIKTYRKVRVIRGRNVVFEGKGDLQQARACNS